MVINKLTKQTQLLKMNRIERSPATMEKFFQNTVKKTQKERQRELEAAQVKGEKWNSGQQSRAFFGWTQRSQALNQGIQASTPSHAVLWPGWEVLS